MLGWIKYLQRVRVETDALKRNKDLASTRTPLSLVRDEGVAGSNPASDQLHKQGADRPHLLANIEHLEARQVHKSVHRRVLRMVKLRQDNTGKYIARKRLPDDVREEYGRRHKAHHEAKFSAPASDGPHIAKQKFREWDAEVTARVEAIRAERKGEGISLTRQQARALAGEWYHWFIARHPTTDLEQWDAVRERVHEALASRPR
jgi:hypothetical protein